MEKPETTDEKIMVYSGGLAMILFFVSLIVGLAPLFLHYKTSKLTSFFVFAPLLLPLIFLPLAFPVLSLFLTKIISGNQSTKILSLTANICVIIFFLYMIVGSIMD